MRYETELDDANLPDVMLLPIFKSQYFHGKLKIEALYKKILFGCVIYSWNLTNADWIVFHDPKLAYMCRHFLFNDREMQAVRKSPYTRGRNAVCVGFPRNDDIEETDDEQKSSCIRIIWAPHWSVKTHSRLGNFDRYADLMLEWVANHPEVEVVLKPHPMLRTRLADKETQARLKSECLAYEEVPNWDGCRYDDFIRKWKALPNARVMDSGGYMRLFKSSSAMILDSISFIAEYMALSKPMCFCNRDRTAAQLSAVFNDTGKALLSGMSIANEWSEIERFMDEVLQGVDDKAVTRNELVQRHLMLNAGRVGTTIMASIAQSLRIA